MVLSNYRVDQETGAVIFKKSAGRQKAQQMEFNIKRLTKKLELLEAQNKLLLNMLLKSKILTDIQFEDLIKFTEGQEGNTL